MLVAPRKASRARDLNDLPDHLGRRFLGAAAAAGPVEAELGSVESEVSLGLRTLALALILAQLLPLPLLLAVVVLLAFLAFLALLALLALPALPALPAILVALLVDGLVAARIRPPLGSSGFGDLSIESARLCRGGGWLAVSNESAGWESRVKGGAGGEIVLVL